VSGVCVCVRGCCEWFRYVPTEEETQATDDAVWDLLDHSGWPGEAAPLTSPRTPREKREAKAAAAAAAAEAKTYATLRASHNWSRVRDVRVVVATLRRHHQLEHGVFGEKDIAAEQAGEKENISVGPPAMDRSRGGVMWVDYTPPHALRETDKPYTILRRKMALDVKAKAKQDRNTKPSTMAVDDRTSYVNGNQHIQNIFRGKRMTRITNLVGASPGSGAEAAAEPLTAYRMAIVPNLDVNALVQRLLATGSVRRLAIAVLRTEPELTAVLLQTLAALPTLPPPWLFDAATKGPKRSAQPSQGSQLVAQVLSVTVMPAACAAKLLIHMEPELGALLLSLLPPSEHRIIEAAVMAGPQVARAATRVFLSLVDVPPAQLPAALLRLKPTLAAEVLCLVRAAPCSQLRGAEAPVNCAQRERVCWLTQSRRRKSDARLAWAHADANVSHTHRHSSGGRTAHPRSCCSSCCSQTWLAPRCWWRGSTPCTWRSCSTCPTSGCSPCRASPRRCHPAAPPACWSSCPCRHARCVWSRCLAWRRCRWCRSWTRCVWRRRSPPRTTRMPLLRCARSL
jgi:hypothetical protein